MSTTEQNDHQNPHTFCVTCHTELPPGTEIKYFSQSPLCPTKDDLSFGQEVYIMLGAMKALFNVLGFSEIEEEETVQGLGKLGHEVADEAFRRMRLLQEAYDILWQRCDTLRKRLGEEVA